jgi:hypothetical protein
MKYSFFIFLAFLSFYAIAQDVQVKWHSESFTNGIRIQNSLPKGGPYKGPTQNHYNYSYLVFFSRVTNETDKPVEISLNFSADSVPIPNSPNTYMKLILPKDTMTMEKVPVFSYGLTELESLNRNTSLKRKINPKEDCLFYVVAIFYQTVEGEWSQERGGNRAQLILKGDQLFYNILPQVSSLSCGKIISMK